VSAPIGAKTYFTKRFRECGMVERAKSEKAYHKSSLRFFGVTVPEVRKAARDYQLAHETISHDDLSCIAARAVRD